MEVRIEYGVARARMGILPHLHTTFDELHDSVLFFFALPPPNPTFLLSEVSLSHLPILGGMARRVRAGAHHGLERDCVARRIGHGPQGGNFVLYTQ